MLRLMLFAVVLLAGCSRGGDPASLPADAITATNQGSVQLTGKQAYDLVCARCHAEGLNGAPKTGDREAWAGRSWLWEAVLFEHAKEGYMEMPAKGGADDLDDTTVEMAAEYMLSLTFPEVSPAD